MLFQEADERFVVKFAHLAQHPADRFMHEIVFVVEVVFGHPQSWFDFSFL
jgi:hypothetical protein